MVSATEASQMAWTSGCLFERRDDLSNEFSRGPSPFVPNPSEAPSEKYQWKRAKDTMLAESRAYEVVAADAPKKNTSQVDCATVHGIEGVFRGPKKQVFVDLRPLTPFTI